MGRVIIVAFAALGWAFYQLSGGADFDPVETRNSRLDAPIDVETIALLSATEPVEEVSRIALDLASIEDVLTPAQRGQVGRQESARLTLQVEEQDAPDTEETARLVLPSLVENAKPAEATVTPVDFSRDSDDAVARIAVDREIRQVTGNRVNVRGGPGTNFSVVNRLVRGDEVEILEDPGNGWVMLRPVGGGPVGWMADFLLSNG